MRGKYIRTDETRQRISVAMKKRKNTWTAKYNRIYKPEQMRNNNPMRFKVNRDKISFALRGRITSPKTLFKAGCLNPAWKGGVSLLTTKIRMSKRYVSLRKSVFERDNFCCQHCGNKNKFGSGNDIYLTMHHKVSFASILNKNNIKSLIQARECSELWDMDNAITLCLKCHKKTKTWGKNL